MLQLGAAHLIEIICTESWPCKKNSLRTCLPTGVSSAVTLTSGFPALAMMNGIYCGSGHTQVPLAGSNLPASLHTKLQSVGNVCKFLRWQKNFRILSSAAFGKMSEQYVKTGSYPKSVIVVKRLPAKA